MKRGFVIIFCCVTGIVSFDGAISLAEEKQKPQQICGYQFQSVVAAFETLTNDAGVSFLSSSQEYLNFQDGDNGLIWTFTRDAHPAHPGLVCQRVVQTSEKVSIDMQVMCGGPKKACDTMVSAFEEHHKTIGRQIDDR